MSYTIKQLENMSDLQFAACILNERYSKLSNPHTPLATKLRIAIGTLKDMDQYRNRGE